MLLCLVLLLPVVFGIAWVVARAIQGRHWGLLTVLGIGLGGLVTLAVMMNLIAVFNLQRDFGGMPALEAISTPSEDPARLANPHLTLGETPLAEPRIAIDDQDAVEAEVATDAEFTDADLDEAFPERKPGQVVLTCDPSATLSGVRKKGAAALAAWVDAEVRDAHGAGAIRFVRGALAPGDFDAYADRFSPATHLSEVNTSVGRVYVLRVLAEMDEANQKWIVDTVAKASAAAQRSRGVRSIAFAGVGVLGLVAVVHLLLRMGPTATPVMNEEAA